MKQGDLVKWSMFDDDQRYADHLGLLLEIYNEEQDFPGYIVGKVLDADGKTYELYLNVEKNST
jgi:hypothetical protein